MDVFHDDKQKVIPIQEAISRAQQYKQAGKTVVTTNGCFDILHVGHVRNLQAAKEHGDVLFVGVNIDDVVRKSKGEHRPYVPAEERAEMLSALSCVDYVFVFEESDPIAWIQEIQPDVHVKGGDYPEDIIERDAVESGGGTVVIVPHSGHSTTDIINKIKDSDKRT